MGVVLLKEQLLDWHVNNIMKWETKCFCFMDLSIPQLHCISLLCSMTML